MRSTNNDDVTSNVKQKLEKTAPCLSDFTFMSSVFFMSEQMKEEDSSFLGMYSNVVPVQRNQGNNFLCKSCVTVNRQSENKAEAKPRANTQLYSTCQLTDCGQVISSSWQHNHVHHFHIKICLKLLFSLQI